MIMHKSDIGSLVYFVGWKLNNYAAPITYRAWIKSVKNGIATIEYDPWPNSASCADGPQADTEFVTAHLERKDWNRVLPA